MARNYPIDMNLAGPVNDNSRGANMSHRVKPSGKHGGGHHSAPPLEHRPSHSPQASSLPGSLGIIHDVRGHGSPQQGIPGIISTTTTSPETRHRLVSGIIDHVSEGHPPTGPVCEVMGHDATAYNTGMVHIRGSPFSSHHKHGEKEHLKHGEKGHLKEKKHIKGGGNPGHK
jgi:hypothetical protein